MSVKFRLSNMGTEVSREERAMATQLSLKSLYIEIIFSASDNPNPTFKDLRAGHGLDFVSNSVLGRH